VAGIPGDGDGLVAATIAVLKGDPRALRSHVEEVVDRLVDGITVDGLEDDELLDELAAHAREPAPVDGALQQDGIPAGELHALPAAVLPLEEATGAEDGPPVEVVSKVPGAAGDGGSAVDLGAGAQRDGDVEDEGRRRLGSGRERGESSGEQEGGGEGGLHAVGSGARGGV
jgi:hypothetical protein